jgi:hypothetical protein
MLIGKLEGKRSLGRPRHRCEDQIRGDNKEIGWEIVDWIIWLRTGKFGGLL